MLDGVVDGLTRQGVEIPLHVVRKQLRFACGERTQDTIDILLVTLTQPAVTGISSKRKSSWFGERIRVIVWRASCIEFVGLFKGPD